jgi:hypothetical protein
MDSYYQSAAGVTISRDRALRELEDHGFDHTPEGRRVQSEMVEQFDQEVGQREEYDAQDVLDFLGYDEPREDVDYGAEL